MAIQTSTGIVLSISAGEPATVDAAGFAAKTYTEVAEVTNIPPFGPQYQVVNHEPLATGVTQKLKGFVNNGSTTITAALDMADAGQLLAKDATDGSQKYDNQSFKIAYQNGDVTYFYGKVFSYTENPSSANSIVSTDINVEINSLIVNA